MSSFDESEKGHQVDEDCSGANDGSYQDAPIENQQYGYVRPEAGALQEDGHRPRSTTSGSSNAEHVPSVSDSKMIDIEANTTIRNPSVSTPEDPPPDPNIIAWSSPTDPETPMNWPFRKRWSLIILVSLLAFLAGLSSSFFAPSVPALMREFHSTNETLASFVVTVFVLGLASGPVVFGPLSELYGRLIVQHVGNVGFLAFTIACALATNLNMMIGFRFLQGCFASTPLTNGGAVISDVVHQEERGFALAIFTLGVLFGPVVGPVAGGFLAAAKGWRWVFWVLAMPLGALTIICIPIWRESYPPVLLGRKAAQLRKETGNPNLRSKYDNGLSPSAYFRKGIGRAMKMLAFSPIILCFSIYNGLSYSYFYLLITTLTPVFENTYHFHSDIVGLSYLGIGVGFMIGVVVFARTSDKIVTRLTAKHKGERKPEYRLPLVMVGAVLLPVALVWYGWTAEKKAPWIVPIVGTGLLGCGNALLFTSIQAYNIDAYTIFAASALAANTVVRSVMASVLPLAAPKMYATLGYGWGNTLLAFLAMLMVPMPWIFYRYGEKLRGLNPIRMKNL